MRINNTFLTGTVTGRVQLFTKNDNGIKVYTRAAFSINVCRRKFMNADRTELGPMVWEIVYIQTRNEDMIEIAKDIKTGDLVAVVGTVSSKLIPDTVECPECHCQVQSQENNIAYVDPFSIIILEKNPDIREADRKTQEMVDFSDFVVFAGNVCQDPIVAVYNDGKTACKFQVASDRLRRIKEDRPDIKADFPWVRCSDRNAKEYSEVLKCGSEVVIVGALETKSRSREFSCPNCLHRFSNTQMMMHIIPYHIEYGENCNIPEPESGGNETNRS